MALTFEILHVSASTAARLGRVTTPHGSFDTPAFMPVGTRATVKGLTPEQVRGTGAQIILANTYHLLLRPGAELIERRGGLHAFANWRAPMLTDSGGYQVFSLSDQSRITEEGVEFKSNVDGSWIHLTPERSIQVQHQLGADIIMAFDDCPPSVDPAAMNQTRLRLRAGGVASPDDETDHRRRITEASERTGRWLERCVEAHMQAGRSDRQALFGIVQGGTDLDERSRSAQRTCAFDLPGYAIGGVAVGEGFDEIVHVVRHTAPLLPHDRPRYLMGVGYERDLVAAVRAGCDMFDCVLPTRNGRNAYAFTATGPIRLRNARFAEDDAPIDDACDCPVCRGAVGDEPHARSKKRNGGEARGHFSRAYLRHLFQVGEMLGPILVSLHNLHHFQRLMLDIRVTIRDDDWSAFARKWPVAARGVDDPPGEV